MGTTGQSGSRVTNRERASQSNMEADLMTEESASIFLDMSVGSLRKYRAHAPKRWTLERIEDAIARNEAVPPPFRNHGRKVVYYRPDLTIWIETAMPVTGALPWMETREERIARAIASATSH